MLFQQITSCPTCHGRGSIIDKPCAEYHGRGETEHTEELTVTIPPGTQPATVLRLQGKGLPAYGQRSRGSLYLRLRGHVPERLSAEKQQLYERLRRVRQHDV